jgi:hypothetical protein
MAGLILSVLEQASGVLVMGLVLADIFLTVLYARIGTGLDASKYRSDGGFWTGAVGV